MDDRGTLRSMAKSVKSRLTGSIPPAVHRPLRDAYHRTLLRAGRNPLGKPDEFERFLVGVLADLDLPTAESSAYVEFGVYQGATLAAAVRALRRCGLTGMRCFGFDSFEGLPVDADRQGWGKGWFAVSRSVTEWHLRRQKVDDAVELVEGWFDDTCTEPMAARIGSVRVVMLDCDLYSATDTALRFTEPLLALPAVVIFDDWYAYNPDESPEIGQVRALHEMLERRPDLVAQRVGRVGHCGVGFVVAARGDASD